MVPVCLLYSFCMHFDSGDRICDFSAHTDDIVLCVLCTCRRRSYLLCLHDRISCPKDQKLNCSSDAPASLHRQSAQRLRLSHRRLCNGRICRQYRIRAVADDRRHRCTLDMEHRDRRLLLCVDRAERDRVFGRQTRKKQLRENAESLSRLRLSALSARRNAVGDRHFDEQNEYAL